MSSFPDHVENIEDLSGMGFDISDCIENGEVSMESWGYDNLVYLMQEIIAEMQRQGFKNGA